MRTNVRFNHPSKFVPVSEDDGVLAVEGAQWFVALLQQIPRLEVAPASQGQVSSQGQVLQSNIFRYNPPP